jgi:hypothetical protein
MSGFSAYQSAPVTQQAVVTVNAGFDRFFCNVRKELANEAADQRYLSTDDHCFTIQQREMVFRLNPKFNDIISRPDSFNGINDMALKVFSSANKFPDADKKFRMSMSRTPLSAFSRDAMLRSTVSFVGVAMQPIDYLNTNQKDNVAVQAAGSCTIWNTGNKVIRPGQRIIWDFPEDPKKLAGKRKTIAGEPMHKHLFATLPLESAFGDARSTSYDFVTALEEIHIKGETEEGKSLQDSVEGGDYTGFLRKALYLYEDVRSRIIGIALSGAAPGEVRCCFHHLLATYSLFP